MAQVVDSTEKRLNAQLSQIVIQPPSNSYDPSKNEKIEEPSEVDGKEPTQRIINMELPPATLKTLVNDLSRIREQLSNIAKK
ncbi:hypothetical protein PV326_003377 [Microctonus aethiopoides]|nr:hypothetical protein PV326_003377 [Microctonus aethiopoides]